jgi:hypothetical protein
LRKTDSFRHRSNFAIPQVDACTYRSADDERGDHIRQKRGSRQMAKSTASTKSITGRKIKSNNPSKRKAAASEVTLDRRTGDRRATSHPVTPTVQLERRQKVNRRRQIDPTTCERDYSDDEVEFMNALDLYKRKSGRMFPTCSEVLEVIRGLGYSKQDRHDNTFLLNQSEPANAFGNELEACGASAPISERQLNID